jgi:site-specific DNA-methyltransferase (adenine-specific)
MPQGALVNIPARFAIKMVDDYGWILKHSIIWHKPNAMPTSNKKKFTPDFEYLFHFVLDTRKYYFKQQFEPFVEDTDVLYRKKLREGKEYNVKDEYKENTPYKHNKVRMSSQESPNRMWDDPESLERQLERGRNKRSVWSVTTKGYKGSHAATYPTELISVPIDAMCPEGGIVFDPFMGAGTTAIEAEAQGKYWIGIELNQEYFGDAIRRIKDERK